MRYYLLLTITFQLFVFLSEAQVKKITAETKLENVTVFSSGARLERSASVSLLPGRTEISFPKLSNQLDQQSVQLKANANITLLSVQTTKDFVSTRDIEEKEKEAIDSLKSLQDRIALNERLLEVYKKEEEMLAKNEAIGGTSGVNTAELKEALDLHRKRLTEIYQKELEIENIIQAQQLALQTSQMTYQEISRKKDSVNYIVTALVESKGTQNVNFQLLYNVKDAGWYSTYDVRVTEVTDPLEILMNANVFQRSGETWKNISLILSTGNPTDNATPPQLQPWLLGYYDPNAPSQNQNTNGLITGRVTNKNGEPIIFAKVGIKGTNIGTATDANGYFKISNPANNELVISSVGYVQKMINSKPGYISIVLEESSATLSEVVVTSTGLMGKAPGVKSNSEKRYEKDEKIQQVTVTTAYQPTTTVYQIKDKYTIETDGKTTTIGIKQMDIPALYEYFTIPKIDPSAFLNAKITNWQDYDLQSGEASLYFEGTYLGKTYLDLSDATDTLTVSLGKDNGIKISRKPVKEFTAKKWIGSNQTDTRTFDISIRNNKKIPVNITVTDQFPVSTNKEISVDDMKADGANVDKETGIITWTITLQPGEEKIVTKSYSVKYPKGRKVVLE